MDYTEILEKLPYSDPFLFVDALVHIDVNGATGTYTFRADSFYYKGHFKGNPVTPGVILTECCAQIGLVCLGIHLLSEVDEGAINLAMSSSEMEFYLPVFPNEPVTVVSEKEYFRFHKLKCRAKMYNSKDELVCKGTISGMFKKEENA